MVNEFERVEKVLNKVFGKPRKLYIAISKNNRPYVQLVDGYYEDKCFYLMMQTSSEIIELLKENAKVSLCSAASFHKAQGEIIGIKQGEDDNGRLKIEVKINQVFTYASKVGYKADYVRNECSRFKFAPHG